MRTAHELYLDGICVCVDAYSDYVGKAYLFPFKIKENNYLLLSVLQTIIILVNRCG